MPVAMRSSEENDNRPIRGLLRKLVKAPAALSFIFPLLLFAGCYFSWTNWGSAVLGEKFFKIDPELVQITPPPTYIRSDIVNSVYEETALENMSLLDSQAAARIASAFATSPWIRQVNSVRKLPGGTVDIRVDYRLPVAMVRAISKHTKVSGFFVVDGDGVLLPTSDFSSSDTHNYIHIEIPYVYATKFAGQPFGETRVEAAAKLAHALTPVREQLGIVAISASGDAREDIVPQLELTLKDGKRVFWGSAPGSEFKGEATALMKVEALLRGDLSENLDLRVAGQNEHRR